MKNIKLKVENMTCSACEAKIEKKLYIINGIINVKADHISGFVEIEFNELIVSEKEIILEIEKLHYNVNVQDNIRNNENLRIAGILLITIAIYFIIKNTIGFNFIPIINQNMSFGMLFIVGLITSIHCMAMCGGINISQCVNKDIETKNNTIADKIRPSFLYNLGRIISYTFIGGIVGAIGSVFSLSPYTQGLIQLIAGILILIMGIKMLNIFKGLNKFGIRMPKFVANKLYTNNRKNGSFIVGLLNGFMPCGPLQTMQLYALGTGSVYLGALSMFFFSVGTVPLMFGLGVISTFINKKSTKVMLKISALIIIILGFNMANRGYVLSGIDLNINKENNSSNSTISSENENNSKELSNSTSNNLEIQNKDVQEIQSYLTSSNAYPTITVKVGVPVKWTISAEKKYLTGCNNAIIIPKYKINKELSVGNNVIEFTPMEVGDYAYSCWMGMIRGKIKVIASNDSDTTKENTTNNVGDENIDTTGLPSCCGGY